ncbi:MAG: DNA mismatch repair protein MutS, partial [Delftia sp.]|nr:DNA mismatch repair protein MutS [Delftia sp.]
APEPPEPLPLQLELDEQRVLQEAMSDEFDVSTLLDTDDQLSFRRPGIGLDVTHKLRAGQWSIQRQLDLHGLRVDEAREALGQFIRLSHRTGIRCVRVVHGKGLGSPGKTPVLKGRVLRWLVQKKEVLAFVQARPAEGGAGALVVLLQPGRRQLY